MSSLGSELPAQIKRVVRLRDRYVSLRTMEQVNVEPAIAVMTQALDDAIDAMATQDVFACIAAYENLKGFSE